jgi:hypothetical protein
MSSVDFFLSILLANISNSCPLLHFKITGFKYPVYCDTNSYPNLFTLSTNFLYLLDLK